MAKKLLFTFFALLMVAPLFSQKVGVYTQVPSQNITARASSELKGFSAQWAVDGSGMSNNLHRAQNLGETMWISDVSTNKVRANAGTHNGVAWLMCEFASMEKGIDFIQIWNHNQNQHTQRGLQKVYIEYSADGKKWSLLKNGNLDYFIINQALGRMQEPASLSIPTKGINLKYFCITADIAHGNYYHDDQPSTLRNAETMHQNVSYYGLSEVRFYRKLSLAASELPKIKNLKFLPSQGYLKTADGPSREFSVVLDTLLYAGGKLTIDAPGKTRVIDITPSSEGIIRIDSSFPAGYMNEALNASITFESKQGTIKQSAEIPAARKWTLYFLSHSHLDIGYTHRQNDVMKLQWRDLEQAMDLAERTRNYPEGSQYKWNAEATWPVQGYLNEYKGTEKAARLIEAIRRGDISMSATLGSILTGISKQEELMHMFDDAHKIAEQTGVPIRTAMTSDVPGHSWGTVTAMAQNGVRYFSSAPNFVPFYKRAGSNGVGLYHIKWGDLPFWWQSQSGNEKILYWQTGKGYSLFHGWLLDRLSVCGVDPIWDYLNELESREYPYDITYLRYTIHGDNGPPDELMPDVIRSWNEKYESPHFVIGTTEEVFSQMETRYGDYLPTYSGDMTPIWEDGAASTARELIMNRESSERLNQSEILWSMLHPASTFPVAEFAEGWKNTVLFSEHTWGASASGPEPESQFTKDLWAGKKLYAENADIISRRIYSDLLERAKSQGSQTHFITVFNTNLWTRSDIVTVNGVDLSGKMLESPAGVKIPVQKLTDGNWIFYAAELPGLTSTSYRIVADIRKAHTTSMIADNVLSNGSVRVEIDKTRGTISSFTIEGDKYEYASKGGLNDYLYSLRVKKSGIKNDSIQNISRITVLTDGEVAATLRVESDAPGCRSLWRDVTVYKNIDRVDILNTLNKLNVYDTESVRFVFPFNFSNPEVSMDLAMSEMHPEREQLVSANKNFYSIQNGLSVSDIVRGVYLTSIDAPFVELGTTSANMARGTGIAQGWLNAATVEPTIYSWVMNNRWRTNYKASQEGITTFRYTLQAFDPEQPDLKKQGSEQVQKLIAIPTNAQISSEALFKITGKNRIALSTIHPTEDGLGYIIRLQNMGPLTTHSSIVWGTLNAIEAYYCDNTGEKMQDAFDASSFWLKPYDCVTIKVIVKK